MSISGTPSQAYSNAVVASTTAETNTELNSTSSATVATVEANVSQSPAARQVTEAANSNQNLPPQDSIVAHGRKRKAYVSAEMFREEQMHGVKRPYFPALSQKTELLPIPMRRAVQYVDLAPLMLRPCAAISMEDENLSAAVLDCLPESVRKVLDQGGMFFDDGLRPSIGESAKILADLKDAVADNAHDRAMLQCYLRYRHDLDGVTPIHFACGDYAALHSMIDIFHDNLDLLRNAILTCANGKGITPLYHVVESGCLSSVMSLFRDKLDALRYAMLQRGNTEHPFFSSHRDAVWKNAVFEDDIKALHKAVIAMGGYQAEEVVGYAPINCLNMYLPNTLAMIALIQDDSDTLIQLCDSLLMSKDFRGASVFGMIGIDIILELAPQLLYAQDNKGNTILHLLVREGREADLAFVLGKLKEAEEASVKH